jgi:hypothetical protein
MFRVVVDGTTLIDVTLDQFAADDGNPQMYVCKTRHLMAKLDLGSGRAMVYRNCIEDPMVIR